MRDTPLILAIKNHKIVESRDLIAQYSKQEKSFVRNERVSKNIKLPPQWYGVAYKSPTYYAISEYHALIFNMLFNTENHMFVHFPAYRWQPRKNISIDITPIFCALALKKNDLAHLLIERGAQPILECMHEKYYTLAHFAVNSNDKKLLRVALQNQEHLNYIDVEFSVTALTRAVMLNNTKFARLILVSGKMQITEVEDEHYLPLHAAIRNDNIEMVILLLEAGYSPKLREKFSRLTAIHLAAELGRLAILKMFSIYGYDLNAANSATDPKTPLSYAIHALQIPVVDYLIARKCTPCQHVELLMQQRHNIFALWLNVKYNQYVLGGEDVHKRTKINHLLTVLLKHVDPFVQVDGSTIYDHRTAIIDEAMMAHIQNQYLLYMPAPVPEAIISHLIMLVDKVKNQFDNHIIRQVNEKMHMFHKCELRMYQTKIISQRLPLELIQFISEYLLTKEMSVKIRAAKAHKLKIS